MPRGDNGDVGDSEPGPSGALGVADVAQVALACERAVLAITGQGRNSNHDPTNNKEPPVEQALGMTPNEAHWPSARSSSPAL
jgi:hypothetical protein